MKKYKCVTQLLFAILLVTSQAETAEIYKSPEYYGNWGLENIGAGSAYDLGFTGKGVPIGVGDSGFDSSILEFHNRIEKPLAFLTYSLQSGAHSFLGYMGEKTKKSNHGTHVAGIIGAARDGKEMHGVAYEAHLIPAIYFPVVLPSSSESHTLSSPFTNTLTFDELDKLAKTDPVAFWKPHAERLISKTVDIKNFVAANNATAYHALKKKFPALKAINQSTGFRYSFFENLAYIDDPSFAHRLQELAQETLDMLLEEAEGDKDLAASYFPNALEALMDRTPNFLGRSFPSSFLLKLAAVHAPRWQTIYDAAKRDGYTIIKAAGNESLVEPPPEHLFTYFYPWAYGTQMIVVATDRKDQITSYSNYCGHAKSYCLAAPGGDELWKLSRKNGGTMEKVIDDGILSTLPNGKYGKMDGTSMAAPHVTGAWALAQEIFPQATNIDIFSLIIKTATLHPGDPQHAKGELSDIYGWGHLNVSNLVQAIHPLTAEIYDSTRQATFSTLTPILENLLERGSAWRRLSGTTSPYNPRRKSLWAYGLKGWGKENRLSTHGSFPFTYASNARINGLMGGYDFLTTEKLHIGLGGAFTETKASTQSGIGTADVKGGHLLGYVNWTQGSWFIDGVGTASVFDTKTQRHHIPGTHNTLLGYKNLHAISKGLTYGFGAEVAAGYTWKTKTGAYVEPYIIGSLMTWNRPGFQEKGADIFNLQGDSALFLNADVGAGARIATPWKTLGPLIGQLEGNIAYLRKVSGTTHPHVSLLGRSIQPLGIEVARSKDTLRLGALLTLKSPSPEGKVEVSFNYQGDLQRKNVLHVMSANFTYRF